MPDSHIQQPNLARWIDKVVLMLERFARPRFRSAISIGGEEVGNPRNQNRSSSAVASAAPIRMAEQSCTDCFLLR
jgi:hypothetical protein